jgi:hypothetical protein
LFYDFSSYHWKETNWEFNNIRLFVIEIEKLLEYIKMGKSGEKLCVRLVSKLDDFHVNLRVGDEDGDIFMIPSSGDSISQQIFHNILRSL